METLEEEKTLNDTDLSVVSAHRAETIQALFALSGKRILEKILDHDNPRQLVGHIPGQDFYWLVKKVGEDDCVPLLKMASDEQRQYLLDLEFWQKDRLDLDKATAWFGRLHLADPKGFVQWFQSKGEAVAYYYLFKSIQVQIRSEDEDPDVDESFFTLDGVFYVKILDEAHRETIRNILRTMAKDNLDQYQGVLSTLTGVIPAEMEEDMYRLRNVRLAEHGFLPAEEAVAVYAPLAGNALVMEDHAEPPSTSIDETIRELIPISPLYHVRGRNILTEAFSGIKDDLVLDRIRLEFAGLCNQILSADGVLANELDILISACRKAAGHLNLALEKLCSTNVSQAEKLLGNNHLVPVFRVGFGLVLELKWEAEQWMKQSWFSGLGLGVGFWGDDWAGTLAGITEKKPRLYTGLEEDEGHKAFEYLSELDDCRRLVHRLKALDRMLARLTETYPLDRSAVEDPRLTFHQMLFNLWARQLSNLEPCFLSITIDQAKGFFRRLRAGEDAPPYRMPGFEADFIKAFTAYVIDMEPELETSLKHALSLIWQEFTEEYEGVATADLEGRFAKFITTDPSRL